MNKSSLAVFAVLAVACSKGPAYEEPVEQGTVRINFAMAETKAYFEETTTNTIIEDRAGFKVASVIHENARTLFFDTARYDRDSGYFATDKEHYFVPGKTLDFYAAYPSSTDIQISDSGEAYLKDYNLKDNKTKGKDLVGAMVKKFDDKKHEMVELGFYHLLTRLNIAFEAMTDDVDYRLDTFTVVYPSRGDYSYRDVRFSSNEDWTLSSDIDSVVRKDGCTVPYGKEIIRMSDLVVLPCDSTILVRVSWTTLKNDVEIWHYSSITKNFSAQIGKRAKILCKLKNSAAVPLDFVITVEDWEDGEHQELEITD